MSALKERAVAFCDRYNRDQGTLCDIFPGVLGEIEQDDYGSVIATGAPNIRARAYPFRFNPTEKQLVECGISESVEAIAYFRPSEVPYDAIQTEFARVIVNDPSSAHDGQTFRVSNKSTKDLQELWTVLGLVRT